MLRPQEPILIPSVAIADLSAPPTSADRSVRLLVVGSMAVVAIAYFYAAVSRSIADHFWMDEVLALVAARQPSLSGVWQVIWAGTDFSPPTFHALLHGLVQATGLGGSPLAWRLPSMLAVFGCALCVYLLLVRSKIDRSAAASGFGLVLALSQFEFAIQVRQYALLVFGLALALLVWSAMGDGRSCKAKACALWAVLAASLSLHFYAIIQVAVIGIAETLYWITRRRLRLSVWLALLLTAPVEVALYPLASHLAKFNAGDNLAPGYYGKPGVARFVEALFEVVCGGRFGMLLFAAAFLIAGFGYMLQRSGWLAFAAEAKEPARKALSGAALSELDIIVVALCALPFMTFGFSLLVTGSFSVRYMAGAALLPAVVVPCTMNELPFRRIAALAMVPLIAAVLVLRAQAPDAIADVLAALQKPRAPLPIVVGEGLLYIELMEAADTTTKSRLVYLKRPEASSSPDPTNENEVIRLATLIPDYRVSEQDIFLKQNSAFYVLSRPDVSTDTTTPALVAKGILESPVEEGQGILLYRSRPIQNSGAAR